MPSLLTRALHRLRLVETPQTDSDNSPREVSVALHTEELGSSGTRNFAGYPDEEYLHKLRGRQAADIWDELRRSDPKIKMVLSAVKNPIKSATWKVQPADVKLVPDAEKHAALMEQILFKDLHQSWTQQVAEILTKLDFGFSLFEVVHKQVLGHPQFGNYTGLRKLAWRSPRTIERWNLNKQNGELGSVSQYAYGDLQRTVDIPAQFLLVFSNEKEGDNYEGVSALRPCYGPWLRKNKYLKLQAIGIEKFAVPTPYMEVPAGEENSEQAANARKVLKQYIAHQLQYIMYPAGWKLGFASPSNFDSSKLRASVDAENVEIALAFLAGFLELGQNGGGGSRALSTDISNFFLQGLDHVGTSICEPFNRVLIRQLVDLNFGKQQAYPELTCSGITEKPGVDLSIIIKNLLDSKAVTADEDLEADVREKYGLPKKKTVVALPTATPALPAVPAVSLPAPSVPTTTLAPQAAQLSDSPGFAIVSVDVSKKKAMNEAEAKQLVQEVVYLDPLKPVVVSEFSYRFEIVPAASVMEGTLKTFEPMEGVTVTYGKLPAAVSG